MGVREDEVDRIVMEIGAEREPGNRRTKPRKFVGGVMCLSIWMVALCLGMWGLGQ